MDRRDALINELRALVAKQAAQLEKQAARIAELELIKARQGPQGFLDLFQATIERYREAKAEKETWATEETASWRSAGPRATPTPTTPRRSRQ